MSNTSNTNEVAQAFSWLRAISGNVLTQQQVIAGDQVIEKQGLQVFNDLIGYNLNQHVIKPSVSGVFDISEKGYNMIKSFEGLSLKSYKDTGGVWTIGHGTIKYPSGVKVKQGDTCTKEQALEWLKNDCKWVDACLDKHIKVKVNQNQFDALASLVYNIGETAFVKSTILRLINENNLSGAAKQFDRWVYDIGKLITGLANRRNAEKKHFLTKV